MSWKRANPEKRLQPLVSIVSKNGSSGIWLDIGTGDGLFSKLLSTILPNVTIIRSDISKHADYGNLGLKSYLQSLGIRENSLSGIICSQVLHYIETKNHSNIIDHLNSLLTESGSLLLIEYKINKSYSWIPYPVHINTLMKHAKDSILWHYVASTEIRDGDRPKFSVLLKKANYSDR
ncbi:MAG: methyltransferase domain-containing protein [Candidatus Kariarchaeaceae archaeon]|jgi:hypothetical protein